MTTTRIRAKKGGELGANGEWYEGGKFIATTERPKGTAPTIKRTRRVEIEPRVWVECIDGMLPLYGMLVGQEKRDWATNTYTLNEDLRGHYATPEGIAQRKAWITAWNAGERWRTAG